MKNTALIGVITAGLLSLPSLTLAGDADACLDCHEPAEDWAGMTADEVFADARSPDNKRHKDNADLSDDQLKAIIAELLK